MIKKVRKLKDGEYVYFESEGNYWKVLLESREVPPPASASADTASLEYAITISVAPCDSGGNALRKAGKPILIDSITHRFNHQELSNPDFDAKEKIMILIEDRINLGNTLIAKAESVNDAINDLKGDI